MARTAKKPAERIILGEGEDSIAVWVKRHHFDSATAEKFANEYKNAEINANRIAKLEQQALEVGGTDEYVRVMNEIEQLRTRPSQLVTMIDYLCLMVDKFEDYYLTPEDAKAGRPCPVTREALKQCDPNELGWIIGQIQEWMTLGGPRGKELSASLQKSSQTQMEDSEQSPISTQFTSSENDTAKARVQ